MSEIEFVYDNEDKLYSFIDNLWALAPDRLEPYKVVYLDTELAQALKRFPEVIFFLRGDNPELEYDIDENLYREKW